MDETASIDEPAARRILLIEDNANDARLVREGLANIGSVRGAPLAFELSHETRLERGLERLAAGDIDLVLLDPSLPDSQGLDSLHRVRELTEQVPVVLLTGVDDDALGEGALEAGAQDFLPKAALDGRSLRRSIRYALERHELQQELLKLSIIDSTTGLYNRRGFLTLAEQYRRRAERAGLRYFAVYVDLDGVKEINDGCGRAAGDEAILEAAEILRRTFRASDILARLGGDEFVVLVTDVQGDAEPIIRRRLELWVEQANAIPGRLYAIALSAGIARGDADEDDGALDALIARADHACYEQKRAKRALVPAPEERGTIFGSININLL
ncbi:MAG: GGDEF domain-containing response regulator [Gemmatimonadaceae bacterium]